MAIPAVSDLHAHVCSMPHCLYTRHMYSDVTAGAHAQDGAHQTSSSTQAKLQALLMAAAWQAGLAGLPAMGKGCRLSRAQLWRPPWTLEVWTASLEKSLRRHLVLQCCPQWIVARLTVTLRKRNAQASLSLLSQFAP